MAKRTVKDLDVAEITVEKIGRRRQKPSLIPTETKQVFFQQKIPQLMKRWKRILLTSVTRLSVSKEQTTLKES